MTELIDEKPLVTEEWADQHTAKEIAAIFCQCYMTDGFCVPDGKPECKCNRLAVSASQAIRRRAKFTRPEVVQVVALLEAARAYRDLCTCYRLHKYPSEKLHNRLDAAQVTLAAYERDKT